MNLRRFGARQHSQQPPPGGSRDRLDDLLDGQFITGQLDCPAHVVIRITEGQRGEPPDVAYGHVLDNDVGRDRPNERMLGSHAVRRVRVILHEHRRAKHRERKTQSSDVLFDLPLNVPVRNSHVPINTRDGRVYQMLDTGRGRSVGYVQTSLQLILGEQWWYERRLNAEYTLDTANRRVQGLTVVHVSDHRFRSRFRESGRLRVRRIADGD